MSIEVILGDGLGTGKKTSLHQHNGFIGPVVFTEEIRDLTPTMVPFSNDDYGQNLNQDASFSGDPELVHDGIDNVGWTATAVAGTNFVFDSTGRPNTGTKSIYVGGPNLGDTMQLSRGSSLTGSDFSSLSFAVNVDRRWSTGDSFEIYGWNSVSGTVVGSSVRIEDYFSFGSFDVWQTASISLADMNLTTANFDSFRVNYAAKAGQSAEFYLDDINLQAAGTNIIEYRVAPRTAKILRVHGVRITLADNISVALANGTTVGLSQDKILGINELSNGIILQWVKNGEVINNHILHNMRDFLHNGYDIRAAIDDGTNSSVTLQFDFPYPVALRPKTEDYLSLVIRDNMSGLLSFKAIAIATEEDLDYGLYQDTE